MHVQIISSFLFPGLIATSKSSVHVNILIYVVSALYTLWYHGQWRKVLCLHSCYQFLMLSLGMHHNKEEFK
jgi:hypothetical protein